MEYSSHECNFPSQRSIHSLPISFGHQQALSKIGIMCWMHEVSDTIQLLHIPVGILTEYITS